MMSGTFFKSAEALVEIVHEKCLCSLFLIICGDLNMNDTITVSDSLLWICSSVYFVPDSTLVLQ